LLYIGYAGSSQSAIPDRPDTNNIFCFQFATNIPCPGIPTVTYEGNVYNTIQINNQCWSSSLTDDGTIWARILGYEYDNINRGLHHEKNGFSIRCLRDNPSE
jgi:hypothetical protein